MLSYLWVSVINAISFGVGQFFVIGVSGGSLRSEKARVIHHRGNVEGND